MTTIIEVPLVLDGNGKVVYPDDISLFGSTAEIGGNLVGEYNGVLVFPIYGGVWPIPVPINYTTVYKTSFFMEEILTRAEFDGMVDSNNTIVKKFVKRKASADTDLDLEHPDDIALIDAMEADGILTTPRHDEILLGVPI